MLKNHLKALMRLETVAVLAAAAVIFGFGLSFLPSSSPASLRLTGVVHVRALIKHPFKHACVISQKQHSMCSVEIALSSNSQPLTGLAAVTGGYGPAQFHTAYSLPCTPGGGVASICAQPASFGPETIAIVDAGNFSSGVSGLNTSLADYDQQFGIPACSTTNGCLAVLNQSGQTSPLPADAGWSDEIALDVETAHMACQTCKVVLVEANDALDADLGTSENTAASLSPTAVSNSYGTTTDDPSYDSDYNHPGMAIVASVGDSGSVSNGAAWPADNPNVIAAAGTTLNINTDNSWSSETLWSSSGGGCSSYYSAPAWQTSLSNWSTAGCGTYRSFGDVSADADPNSGAAINENGTWYQLGGTSLSSPLIASIFALDGGIPSTTTGSTVPYSAATTSDFHDIISGNDCTTANTTHCTAASGFDTPTGLGSPNGIDGFLSLPSPPDLSAITINQNQINLSWTASQSINSTISGYHLYRNGQLISTLNGTNYSDSSLTPNTTYNYTVSSYSSSGASSTASNTATAFSAYAADINEDGHINLLDLSLLASKYGQCGPNLGRSDINGDGCVNLLDLSLLASKYGSE